MRGSSKRGRKAKPHEIHDGIEHKWCGGCTAWKPLSAFDAARPSKPTWDGKRMRCTLCTYRDQRASRRRYDERNKLLPPSTEPQRCARCRETKPAGEFYRCVTRPSGLATYCKPCSREYTGGRASLETVKAVRRKWAQGIGRKALMKYRTRYPGKVYAQATLRRMVAAGLVYRETVCPCGSEEMVEAHHDDYAKVLEVRWLCRKCHKAWHREHGEAANADVVHPNVHAQQREAKAARLRLLPAMLAEGMRQKEMAAAFGVTQATICQDIKALSLR